MSQPSLCQLLCDGPAVRRVTLPGSQQTLTVCEPCWEKLAAQARSEIVRRLREQEPHKGKEIVYQPVAVSDAAGWQSLRPDSPARLDLMIELAGKVLPSSTTKPSYFDAGCNTGYFCHGMGQRGFDSTGLDVVPGDIVVAQLLDAYVFSGASHFVCADAGEFLPTVQPRSFDVASSFSMIQWVIIQSTPERGLAALDAFVKSARFMCVLELGYLEEGHYKDRLAVPIDRYWTEAFMREHGDFDELTLYPAGERGLKRDVFVGTRREAA